MKSKDQFGLPQLASLLVRSRLDFFSEGKIWRLHSIPLRKKANMILAGIDNMVSSRKMLSLPPVLKLEPANVCDLDCPGCWTNDARRKGKTRFLSLSHFERIMAELGDYLNVIWLWGWGEPFLNKNIYEIINKARQRHILVICSTHGNVNWDRAELEAIVKSGLSMLTFAVDGTDDDTYSSYRISGSMEKVLDNIRLLVETKKRLGLVTPLVNMRMLVMAHNEHQTREFLALGQRCGADIVSYKGLCNFRKEDLNNLFPVDQKYLRYHAGHTHEDLLKDSSFNCTRPWRRMEIFADGAVTPCEFDLDREWQLGSLEDRIPLKNIWNNEVMQTFMQTLLSDMDAISFCKQCPYKGQVVSDPTLEYHALTDAAGA
jgi:radical SAM protein with 4Fe4S-binding SPASM domain